MFSSNFNNRQTSIWGPSNTQEKNSTKSNLSNTNSSVKETEYTTPSSLTETEDKIQTNTPNPNNFISDIAKDIVKEKMNQDNLDELKNRLVKLEEKFNTQTTSVSHTPIVIDNPHKEVIEPKKKVTKQVYIQALKSIVDKLKAQFIEIINESESDFFIDPLENPYIRNKKKYFPVNSFGIAQYLKSKTNK